MATSISADSHSQASPAAVFDLLVRGQTWPSWSPIDSAEVDDPSGRQQVGDKRIFHTGRAVSVEPVTELIPDRLFRYEIEPGKFFRSYQGTVRLAAAPQGGTQISWSAVFEPALPLSGFFWRLVLTRFMRRMADGLAEYAAQGH